MCVQENAAVRPFEQVDDNDRTIIAFRDAVEPYGNRGTGYDIGRLQLIARRSTEFANRVSSYCVGSPSLGVGSQRMDATPRGDVARGGRRRKDFHRIIKRVRKQGGHLVADQASTDFRHGPMEGRQGTFRGDGEWGFRGAVTGRFLPEIEEAEHGRDRQADQNHATIKQLSGAQQ